MTTCRRSDGDQPDDELTRRIRQLEAERLRPTPEWRPTEGLKPRDMFAEIKERRRMLGIEFVDETEENP